jgi:hypothetical protein
MEKQFYFLDIAERHVTTYTKYEIKNNRLIPIDTSYEYENKKFKVLCPDFLKNSAQAKKYVKEIRKKLYIDSSYDATNESETKLYKVFRCRRKKIYNTEYYFSNFDAYEVNLLGGNECHNLMTLYPDVYGYKLE